MIKNVSILGSTGSIGKQALDVIRENGKCLRVVALCSNSNAELLARQANEFMPEYIGIRDNSVIYKLKALLNYSPVIYTGESAAMLCACVDAADIILNAISGVAALVPFIAALQHGKTVAAANKESIVCGHKMLEPLKQYAEAPLTKPFANGARIIPVDSEQCAIFQCLEGEDYADIKQLILTASGGMFHSRTPESMRSITPDEAMNHPNWSMGKKITIDSSTMFNKGLEIMEASFLFNVPGQNIDVVVQPQSIIHSMVKFRDNSIKAQLAVPDMRASIQYAFSYPERRKAVVEDIDFIKLGGIAFEPVNPALKKAIELAYSALHENDGMPIVYNAANEAAVDMFIRGESTFVDIPRRVEYAMSRVSACQPVTLDDIMAIDFQARMYAIEWKER